MFVLSLMFSQNWRKYSQPVVEGTKAFFNFAFNIKFMHFFSTTLEKSQKRSIEVYATPDSLGNRHSDVRSLESLRKYSESLISNKHSETIID